MDAELTFRVTDTSLDPYLRVFEPRLSPFTTAVASGTRARRRRARRHRSPRRRRDGRAARRCKLFDYRRRATTGRFELALDQHVLRVRQLPARRRGHAARARRHRRPARPDGSRVHATGDANLGILQGFFRDIRSSGAGRRSRRRSTARCAKPVFSGSAAIDGRPHPPFLAAALARGHQRQVCRSTPRGIRIDEVTRAARRRRRHVRRPHRPQRLRAGRSEPDRDRRADAPPLPGRVPVGRRRPVADR